MSAPLTFIVILSWNRSDMVLRCLANLAQLQGTNHRVVVIDNASTDGTPDAVRMHFPHHELICSDVNRGYAGGVNLGIRHALEGGAAFVWLLNDDTIVPPDALQRLIAQAEASPEIGAISPVIFYEDVPERLQFSGTYLDVVATTMRAVTPAVEPPRASEVEVLSGAALLLRRTAIEATGLFDEGLFAYWEDFDYSMRLQRAGFTVAVASNVRILHGRTAKPGSVFRRPPHYFYLIMRNQYFFWRRYRRGGLRRATYVMRFAGDVLQEAAVCRQHGNEECASACLDALWDAVRGRHGPFEGHGHMPAALRYLCSWHPFFWGAVLRGDWARVLARR